MNTAKASKESDVYSFGVVVPEIATGHKSRNPGDISNEKGLIEWVWDLYGKGDLISAVDQRLGTDYDAKQAECLMMAGLWCAHPDHTMRPSVRQVIQVLNFETTLPSLPPKMPIATYHVPVHSASSSVPSITSTSIEVGR
ncbi:L-type lectin-domain containing receptor kinase IX.1-like [Chenopodium quinoa]|uniref:L-type lectin-domain containing receptor kinase IX.1-like n=1 Tax=Chenopodium quinoa TaxID=63459 RepID=UPI000B76E870|nr:L-type lectin-domain containing receptor kinase IX.1-like [Chenopodium quinoa]